VFKSTTILSIRRDNEVAIGGDGQVTLGDGNTIVKHTATKVQRIESKKEKKVRYQVLVGFAGAGADALAFYKRLKEKLEEFNGKLDTAAVELAKDWRADRFLRRLDAMLAAADAEHSFLISGSGDIIIPDDGVLAIGSGGPMALAAARALLRHSNLTASEIVKEALNITSDICVYTNSQITVESLKLSP